jgi:transcriptional regulator with XRE-family HTH domain
VHPLQRRFGKVLQQKRWQADLSQEALAEKAGLHRDYIGLLERGLRIPSILAAQRLAHALGTTMSELLAEVDR